MNDSHAQFDKMPPIEVRKESLINFTNTFVNDRSMTEQNLESIVQSVVEQTQEYSACGYWIFGIKEEQERLCDLIRKLK